MGIEPDDSVDAHVSAMLVEASRLHQAAMGELHSPHDNPLPRLRKALMLLESASVLAEDSASYVDNAAMLNALKQLHQQQGQVQALIIQLEARRSNPSFLPWLLVALILLVVSGAIWA